MKTRVLLILVAGFLLAADDARDAASKKEREKLEGKWLIIGAERDGKKSPEDEIKEAKPALTFRGDRLISSFARNGEEKKNDSGSFAIDPLAKPKTIDLTGFPVPGKKFLGIYELEGDTLKICFSEAERPKEFASKAGSKTGILTLRKHKE